MRQLVNAVMDDTLAKRLDDYRWDNRLSRSAVMRKALIEYLDKHASEERTDQQPQAQEQAA